MSYDESIPTDRDWWENWSEKDRAEFLEESIKGIARAHREAKYHDRDGWEADWAGSEKCIAAGHVKPEAGWGWLDDDTIDEEHPNSFDGAPMCMATAVHGVCCTACEGECDGPSADYPIIWELVGIKAVAA